MNRSGTADWPKRVKAIGFCIGWALGLAYVGDASIYYYRTIKNKNPFGKVQLTRYYAIPEKNNKVEFIDADPETVDCVHALFPHAGDAPCWYAQRQGEERIDE